MLLAFDPTKQYGDEGGFQTIGQVFENGGKYFLLGILSVFAVLGLIWAFIELFHRFCNIIPSKNAESDSAPIPTPAPVAAPVAPAAPATDDAEIIAVIAAAIEAAKAETPNGQFRVVSFRKR